MKKYECFSAVITKTRGLALLAYLLLLGAPVNSLAQIKAGTSFLSIPPNRRDYNLFPGNRFYHNVNHVFIYPNNTGCVRVSIDGLGFNETYALKKDSLLEITLPKWPRFAQDSVQQFSIKVHSSVPINIYQSMNTLSMSGKGDTIGSFAYFIKQIYTSALALSDNRVFRANHDQFISHPLGNLNYELNRHSTTFWPEYRVDFYLISTSSLNLTETYLNGFLHNYLSRPVVTHSFKDTIELALNKAAFIWRTSESVSHPTSVRGEFDWTSEGSISSKNRQGFKLFTMAIPISGFPSFTYGIALDIDHYGVVRLDIEGSGYTLIEVKPQYLLSSSYHFPKFETYAGQSLSVQAMEDSTDIFFNGRFLIRLDRGKRFDTAIVEDLSLSANQPFSAIVHPWPDTLGNYTPPNGVLSNFALQANGDQELIKHSKVPVLHRNKNIINFLSLVSPSTDTGLVRINGQVPQSNWKTFTGDPAWSYLQERLGLGVHDVQSTAGFHGYFYTSAPYFPDSVFGNYAYVLTEYAPWPEDSFTTYLGREPTKLLPWDEWKDTSLTFCPGDTIYGLASALRNTDWLWMANDSIIAEQTVAEDRANKPIALVLPYGNELELKLQDRNGCLVSKSLKLNLKDLSPLELSYEITPRCEAYQIMLKAENTAPSAQLNWLIDGKAYTGNNILIKHKTADDSLQFSLFRQEKGCQDSLSTAIPLKGADDNTYRFPNLLTPNGDGINDQWCFEDWLGYEACFSIYITDRNGQSVFQSSDPQRCWTPQSQLTGVFYYVLKYGAEEKKGFISFF